MRNTSKLIIITGPSGVGKGTVVRDLLNRDNNLWLSVSATTRGARIGEIEGENYYFLSKNKFQDMIKKGLFLEWAEFAGNYYGTPIDSINKKLNQGLQILLEIEVAGASQVRKKFPNCLSIFLLPPNMEELERRIRGRETESEESILKRLKRAEYEIQSSQDFDFVITNIKLEKTVREIFQIIQN